jgi:hypothetical protein
LIHDGSCTGVYSKERPAWPIVTSKSNLLCKYAYGSAIKGTGALLVLYALIPVEPLPGF